VGRHAAERHHRPDPEQLHLGHPHAQHPCRDHDAADSGDAGDAGDDHGFNEVARQHPLDHVGHDHRRPHDATDDDRPTDDRDCSDDGADDHRAAHDDRALDHRDHHPVDDGRERDDAGSYRVERVTE
jgi:hypothetical protein